MIYVFLATICMTMLVLSLKISGIRKANNSHVIMGNYIVAFLASLTVSLLNGYTSVLKELPGASFATMFTAKDLAATALLCVVLGLVSGIAFPMNLFYINDSIPANGSAITSFFKQMSTLGGLLVAVVFLGERPEWIQWIGIVLMIAAIVLMVCDFSHLEIRNGLALILILVTGTFMETDNKLFSKYAVSGYSTLFLTFVFGIAIIYTTIRLKRREGTVFSGFSKVDVFYGCLLGITNVLNNYFKIKALTVVPAAIVIPCVAAGSLILTNLVGILVFKEKANRTYVLAVVLAVISLFLLNR